MHHSSAPKADHANDDGEDDTKGGDVGDDHGRTLHDEPIYQPQQQGHRNQPEGGQRNAFMALMHPHFSDLWHPGDDAEPTGDQSCLLYTSDAADE